MPPCDSSGISCERAPDPQRHRLVLAGIWLAIGYALAGLIMFILIITIPFCVQAFKLASFALWPFGREIVSSDDLTNGAGAITVPDRR
jgi:uncharacterized membrane protein YccF (DUF307 family)